MKPTRRPGEPKTIRRWIDDLRAAGIDQDVLSSYRLVAIGEAMRKSPPSPVALDADPVILAVEQKLNVLVDLPLPRSGILEHDGRFFCPVHFCDDGAPASLPSAGWTIDEFALLVWEKKGRHGVNLLTAWNQDYSVSDVLAVCKRYSVMRSWPFAAGADKRTGQTRSS